MADTNASFSFWQDVVRAFTGKSAPRDADGRPLLQPWSVRPGLFIALLIGVIGGVCVFLFPGMGIALGFLGFILANTGWAHLRTAGRPRRWGVVGQLLNAVVVLVSIGMLVF